MARTQLEAFFNKPYVHPGWIVLPGILGVTLLQSGFTGFCPVYYILDRTCPAE